MNLLPLMTTILKTKQFCRNCLQVAYLPFLAIESANRVLKRALPNAHEASTRRSTAPRQYFKYLSKGQNPVESHCTQNVSCTHQRNRKKLSIIRVLCSAYLWKLHEIIFGYVLKSDFPGFIAMESCGNLHACA